MTEIANVAAWLPYKQAHPLAISQAPTPSPKPSEILIRVRAVSIEPADVAVQKLGVVYTDFPMVPGCNAAGEIISVGPEVRKLKNGDRVVVSLSQGAFQLYTTAAENFAAKIPDDVTFEEAAVVGLALVTSTVCCFEADMLAWKLPDASGQQNKASGETVLVWGGASALGSCAIQMATASGYEVVSTASQKNFGYVKSLGAKEVFDYKKAGVVDDIVQSLLGKKVAGAFCPIFSQEAVRDCANIMDRAQGRRVVASVIVPLLPIEGPIPQDVRVAQCWHSALDSSKAANFIFGTWLEHALREQTFTCRPDASVVGSGLEHIQAAMDQMDKEGVSARRLVVSIP